ncbi:hypothetical protein PR048_027941 [Dryococelus australis]|uniref:Uncharacterized protein n=1 Tax=Dryococelus australis TaxID=614101 RepID=A0ABQ9GHZ1_9NEOP|nr:hypothetical protein PR048_027941 [Dryococelus australis]
MTFCPDKSPCWRPPIKRLPTHLCDQGAATRTPPEGSWPCGGEYLLTSLAAIGQLFSPALRSRLTSATWAGSLACANRARSRGETAGRALASASIPGEVASEISNEGIVPDDVADRQVFSGISLSPPPVHSGAALYSPRFPSSIEPRVFREFIRRRVVSSPQILPRFQVDPRVAFCLNLKEEKKHDRRRLVDFLSGSRGCGGVVRLLASHLDELGSIPGGISPGFSHVRIVPDEAAGSRVFSGISHFPRAPSFRRCSILTTFRPRRLSRPRSGGGVCDAIVSTSPTSPAQS